MKKLLYILSLMLCIGCIGNGENGKGLAAQGDSCLEDSPIVAFVDSMAQVQGDSLLGSMSPQQIDSIYFRLTHHYSENYNFVVKTDSMLLIPFEDDFVRDTCVVYSDDVIAVAAIRRGSRALVGSNEYGADSIERNEDEIWVKVAHDQETMGWVRETELLDSCTPDDEISELLSILSTSRGIWMSVLVILGFVGFILRQGTDRHHLLRKFTELHSFYPHFFLIMVSLMASLYASVQNFVPEYWQEYYFHPTLNPLQLPLIMSLLVTLLWMTIISFIAVVDVVIAKCQTFRQGCAYLLELVGIAMVVYLFISWTTIIYIGYLILPAFVTFDIWFYAKYDRTNKIAR